MDNSEIARDGLAPHQKEARFSVLFWSYPREGNRGTYGA
jgi:hypothetical protein